MGKLNFQKGTKSPSAEKMEPSTTNIISNFKVEKNCDFSNALISILVDELEFWIPIFRKVLSCFVSYLQMVQVKIKFKKEEKQTNRNKLIIKMNEMTQSKEKLLRQ